MKACLAGLLLLAALPAAADKGQWSLSMSPGAALVVDPSGGFGREHGNSVHLMAGVEYELADGYWYGLELGYSPGHQYGGRLEGTQLDGDGRPDPVRFTSDVEEKMLHVTPLLRVGGMLNDELAYAFSVGAGVYAFFRGAGTAILSGVTSSGASVNGQTLPLAPSNNAFPGLNLGHTLSYGLNDYLQLGLDIRYHLVFMPGGAAGLVAPGLRLGFLF